MGEEKDSSWLEENKWIAVWISAGLTVLLFLINTYTTFADWLVGKPLTWFSEMKTGLTDPTVAVPETAAWLISITAVVFPIFFVYHHHELIIEFAKHVYSFKDKWRDSK